MKKNKAIRLLSVENMQNIKGGKCENGAIGGLGGGGTTPGPGLVFIKRPVIHTPETTFIRTICGWLGF